MLGYRTHYNFSQCFWRLFDNFLPPFRMQCKFGEPQQIVINLILSSKRAKSI